MPARTIRYLKRAQGDLRNIVDYIASDNPAAAAKFIEDLDRSLGRLAHFPESGATPRDRRLKAQGYRIVVFGEYLAFYRVIRSQVRISRVLHGKRRYEFLL